MNYISDISEYYLNELRQTVVSIYSFVCGERNLY